MSTVEAGPSSQALQVVTKRKHEDEEEAGLKKKKRNRKAVSCRQCRTKKVKCDRTYPCSSCKIRGELCEWVDAVPLKESEMSPHDLANEIGRLHGVVRTFGNRLGMDQKDVDSILAPSMAVVASTAAGSHRPSRIFTHSSSGVSSGDSDGDRHSEPDQDKESASDKEPAPHREDERESAFDFKSDVFATPIHPSFPGNYPAFSGPHSFSAGPWSIAPSPYGPPVLHHHQPRPDGPRPPVPIVRRVSPQGSESASVSSTSDSGGDVTGSFGGGIGSTIDFETMFPLFATASTNQPQHSIFAHARY